MNDVQQAKFLVLSSHNNIVYLRHCQSHNVAYTLTQVSTEHYTQLTSRFPSGVGVSDCQKCVLVKNSHIVAPNE